MEEQEEVVKIVMALGKRDFVKVFGVIVFANVATFTGLALAARLVQKKEKEV